MRKKKSTIEKESSVAKSAAKACRGKQTSNNRTAGFLGRSPKSCWKRRVVWREEKPLLSKRVSPPSKSKQRGLPLLEKFAPLPSGEKKDALRGLLSALCVLLYVRCGLCSRPVLPYPPPCVLRLRSGRIRRLRCCASCYEHIILRRTVQGQIVSSRLQKQSRR